jgi:hyaluronoglucosaminidase
LKLALATIIDLGRKLGNLVLQVNENCPGLAEMALRGIVEGFYGKPFDPDQRLRLIEAISVLDHAGYLYAPKNDPWHRIRWRRPYPDAEWRNVAKAAAGSADLGVSFIFGISPLDLGKNDQDPLLSKAERAVNAGASGLALLFDDVDEPLRPKLAEIQSRVTRAVGERFDLDLFICPSAYCTDFVKRFDEGYTAELSVSLPKDVTVLWTGKDVVPRGLDRADLAYAESLYGRKAAAWDNLLADDYCLRRIFLGEIGGRTCGGHGYLLNPSSCFLVALHAAAAILRECGAKAGALAELELGSAGWKALRMFHYLPWKCGPGGAKLLEEMAEAISGGPSDDLVDRLRRMRSDVGRLVDELPAVSGGYDLMPYALDLSRFLGIALEALSASGDGRAANELSRLLFERLPYEHPLAAVLARYAR